MIEFSAQLEEGEADKTLKAPSITIAEINKVFEDTNRQLISPIISVVPFWWEVEEKENKLPKPSISIIEITDYEFDSGNQDDTTAILGKAILGRAILGKY